MAGSDTITVVGADAANLGVVAGDGDDVIVASGSGGAFIDVGGEADNDDISLSGTDAAALFARGDDGNDTLTGIASGDASINLEGGADADSISLQGIDNAELTGIGSGGEDNFLVTSTGTRDTRLSGDDLFGNNGNDAFVVHLGALTGGVFIDGYEETDSLEIFGTAANETITKTADTITCDAPVEQVIFYASIETVTINAGAGDDTIIDPGENAFLFGDDGNDTIIVDATTGNGVFVDGGDNSDTIIAVLGSLDGPVTVLDSGTTGSDTLVVQGTDGDDEIAVSATGVASGGQSIILATTLAALAIDAGAGNDAITVSDLGGNAGSLSLDGGAGADSFELDNVGASVDSLAIDGGDDADQLTVQGELPADTTIVNVVESAPPAATVLGPTSAIRQQPTTFFIDATDASPSDNAAGFEYSINWGDGSPIQIIPATAGNGAGVSVEHAFATAGSFMLSVTAKDQGGETSPPATHNIAISVAAVIGNNLVVGGTSGDDVIHFAAASGGNIKAYVNGAWLGPYTASGRAIAYGGAGNDLLSVGTLANRNGWLFGGSGIDLLNGGPGDDVLDGGPGLDLISGGLGRDLIIGGDGSDSLFGNADEDIIVAGTTAYDGDEVALAQIMAEWTSTRSFDQRTRNLEATGSGSSWSNRANGNTFLIAQPGGSHAVTVFDDDECDLLMGGLDRDWFFANLTGPGNLDLIADLTLRDLTDDLVLVDSLDQ
jgi:Ca2+-binding RTX toxin-like protein